MSMECDCLDTTFTSDLGLSKGQESQPTLLVRSNILFQTGVSRFFFLIECMRTDDLKPNRADKAVIYDPYQSQGWEPIGDLNHTDADVSIFFLNSNGVRYLQKVLDPLFYATGNLAFRYKMRSSQSTAPPILPACLPALINTKSRTQTLKPQRN